MGIWDVAEYMNEVSWPETTLKQGYHIEMCFLYPDEEQGEYVYVVLWNFYKSQEKG